MKVLFHCQAQTLDLFYDLFSYLKETKGASKACFIISDSYHYKKFLNQNPNFENEGHLIIKEWVLNKSAENIKPDIKIIEEYQKKLLINNFWAPICADRRIMWGPKYNFRQDYKSLHNHDEILSILSVSLKEMEKIINDFQPNFMVSFICTTVMDYLGDYFSRKENIPFLNLRATRVENYMHFAPSVEEPSNTLKDVYDQFLEISKSNIEILVGAKLFIENSKKSLVKYEGVFLPTQNAPQSHFKLPRFNRIFKNLKEMFNAEYQYRFNFIKTDRHVPGFIEPLLYRIFFNPILVNRINSKYKSHYVKVEELKKMSFAFYALHVEPEVTLLVYARNFTNQIENIRNIAFNLPVGMYLVVKEHPAAVGKRPLRYYSKLLEIPNVKLIASNVTTAKVIPHAKLIVSISGSVGLEGVLSKKPVLLFGHAPYEILPDTMVKRAGDYSILSESINFIISHYKYDEEALLAFIFSIMKTSVPVDFYTTLLKRKGQFEFSENPNYNNEIIKLGDFTINAYLDLQKKLDKNNLL